MKIRIIFLYVLAFIIIFLCSCSENVDTPARVVRNNSWTEKSKNDVNLSLSFKNDDAVLKITDDKKKEYVITGVTVVTDNEIRISDKSTLTDYVFTYTLKEDSVNLKYRNKTLKLIKNK